MTITIFASTLPKYKVGFYLCITLMTENLQIFFSLVFDPSVGHLEVARRIGPLSNLFVIKF